MNFPYTTTYFSLLFVDICDYMAVVRFSIHTVRDLREKEHVPPSNSVIGRHFTISTTIHTHTRSEFIDIKLHSTLCPALSRTLFYLPHQQRPTADIDKNISFLIFHIHTTRCYIRLRHRWKRRVNLHIILLRHQIA